MKSILSMLGITAALVMAGVSAAMNYVFLASLGKTPLEGQMLGAASAAADVLKALLPFYIAWSWQAGRMIAAVSGTLAFVLFASFSLLSAIGFAADNRGVLVDGREGLNAAYERMQRDVVQAESKRLALPNHRPASLVAEFIGSHQQNRRWVSTKACTNATEVESVSYCEQFFALRAELAAAKEEERLSGEIDTLQSQTHALRAQGAGHETDPQVALLSRIFGQDREPVRLALIIAVAVLVEIGASLGLFLASGHGGGSRVQAVTDVSPVQPDREAAPARQVGSVEDFCLEALAPSKSGEMSTQELWAAYESWSRLGNFQPLDAREFAIMFEAIAKAIDLPRDANGYRGIAPKSPDRSQVAA